MSEFEATGHETPGSKNENTKSILPEITKINLVIHGGNNLICLDSRDIAKEFGRSHKNILQTLDSLLLDGTISRLESKPRNYKKLGRDYRCFELNKAGFFKAMPFIGGKKSREGQKRLVDAILELEAKFIRQSKEREKLACQIARLSGKGSREILTDEIQRFVAYAKKQGASKAHMYFVNITKAAYNTLLIIEPKATQIRELLTALQLSQLSTIELTAAQVLTDGMNSGIHYKEIYQNLKNTLAGFSAHKTKLLS
jgi:phage regulator Rha-like protein